MGDLLNEVIGMWATALRCPSEELSSADRLQVEEQVSYLQKLKRDITAFNFLENASLLSPIQEGEKSLVFYQHIPEDILKTFCMLIGLRAPCLLKQPANRLKFNTLSILYINMLEYQKIVWPGHTIVIRQGPILVAVKT